MFDIFTHYSLSLLLIIPLFGALFIALCASNESDCRNAALFFSMLILFLTLSITYTNFNPNLSSLQYVENYPWFGKTISFKLGIDGLSISMVLLMAILLPITIIASEPIAQEKPKLYYSLLMVLATSVIGVFIAQDLFLFFLLWELELVPMYFLIALWGGPNRNYASMKFLIYTFIAGGALLIGTLLLYFSSQSNSFDMQALALSVNQIPHGIQVICFLLFFFCFIVKLPSFPFHTWLPDAHVEAPTPISMLLAGVLLKMGGYGIYRICIGFFPNILSEFALFITLLATVNILGGAIACLVQEDMKKVIAYSSVSHMGFILLGAASFTAAGYSGGIFQMFSHGLISAALFMLVGTLYERTHTRIIAEYGGMAKYMPKCFYFFILGAMANLALPALSGFVGESLVFYGAFSSDFYTKFPTSFHFNFGQLCVIFSSLGVILTAGYMLWLTQRVFMGEANSRWEKLSDLRMSEVVVLGVLFALVILYGVYPSALSNIYSIASEALL